ncbi:hypothetical protein [Campylobacter concisus]|jgi:addiction module killer protein|uniref:hypothetical protein n=1 Tax=Campylobacter concisus TaxID=199 RepID=UPI0015E1B2E7|nr:hypothetical protein [Campylobacter concisus]
MKVLKSSTFDKWLHKLNNPIVKVSIDGNEIIILLNAGDKDSQSDDIKKAKEILKDYR